MEMDLGEVRENIRGVAVLKRCGGTQYVTKFAVSLRHDDGAKDEMVGTFDVHKEFTDPFVTAACIRFSKPMKSRYVRIWPIEWKSHISLRACVLLSVPCL